MIITDALKRHPFAIEAYFKRSVVVTYAVPQDALFPFLPPCLEPDSFQGKWGFIAMAIVDTRQLRPAGFPKMLGRDFILVGYRIFVRYHSNEGRRLRGLYILKSLTNKHSMQLLGNVFTHYNYSTTDIKQHITPDEYEASSVKCGFHICLHRSNQAETPLPATSPFNNWQEARRFAGPLPHTFTYIERTNEVLTIQGQRLSWTPSPREIVLCQVPFIERLNLPSARLASAFIVEDVDYRWETGKSEIWQAR